MMTRQTALERETEAHMSTLSTLAELAEDGDEHAERPALDLLAEIQQLEVEAAIERARPAVGMLSV